MLERDAGRLDTARDLLVEAIRTLQHLGATLEVAVNLGRLANVLALRGEGELAARLIAKSDAMTEDLGVSRAWWDTERNEKTRALLAGLLEEAALAQATERGRAMSTDEAVAAVLGSAGGEAPIPQ
jgi:hypothetical protein